MLKRLGALAGLLALSLTATAFDSDATIHIDRALNSPTLTVRYSGAAAALAELRLNGDSYGTRVLNPSSLAGETNFTLGMSVLNEGENDVEIRLFDKDGALLGTQRTIVFAEKAKNADVFLSNPKAGQTLQGPTEIKVGFSKDLKNPYVSFFVDNQFKLMTNFPPYTYLWDTVRENNGWHEVEAWVVDDTSETLKSKKVRIFVNNPGGHTSRVFSPIRTEIAPAFKPLNLVTATNPGIASEPMGDAAMRSSADYEPGLLVFTSTGASAPGLHAEVIANPIRALVAMGMSSLRLSAPNAGVPTGPRDLTPTGTRIASQTISNPDSIVSAVQPYAIKVSAQSPAATVIAAAPTAMAPKAAAVIPTLSKPATAPAMRTSATIRAEVSKPMAEAVIAAPTAKAPRTVPVPKPTLVVKATNVAPVVVAKAPAKPAPKIVAITKTVTTLVKIAPGVRIPHRGSYAVVMDGKLVEFDVQPRVDDGVPMTPFRHLVEKRGGSVDWHSQDQSVTASAEGKDIYLQIGTKIAQIDHAPVEMELAPYIEKGRTIVPLSFMRESLHVNIEYDKATNHVLITSIKN